MSSVAMSNAERCEALKKLGYTDREATFLCLAALHGGYFVRRQYCDFIGKEIGGTATALVEKLLAQQYAVAVTALNNTKIYHLASKPFYAVIGETDNRNRREHSALAVKKRLMSLDFVLAHDHYRFLATERERVDYFSGTLGISVSALPYKRYTSPRTPSTTTRYFVDKFPIFLSETGPTEPRATPCFCFVDAGSVTLSAFEIYLDQYSALWRCFDRFEIIYVADTKCLYSAAKSKFSDFLRKLESAECDPSAQFAKRIIQHFEARFQYEKGAFSSFNREKLLRLRNEMVEFARPQHQTLYERWKEGGAQSVLHVLSPGAQLVVTRQASISVFLVENPYVLFGETTNR